jgi:hypothetical protein
MLAGFFSDIFNLSLSQAVVPTCFKETTIVAVPKKNVSCPNDYSTFTLTSVIMKCLERLVKASMPGTLDPLQFAYRSNRSMEDTFLCNWIL